MLLGHLSLLAAPATPFSQQQPHSPFGDLPLPVHTQTAAGHGEDGFRDRDGTQGPTGGNEPSAVTEADLFLLPEHTSETWEVSAKGSKREGQEEGG